MPKEAGSPTECELVVDGDGTTAPVEAIGSAEERYPTDPTPSAKDRVTPTTEGEGAADLEDVPDRAARLLALLRAHDSPVTAAEAQELAAEHDADLAEKSHTSFYNWVDALEEAGAVEGVGEGSTGATRFDTV